MPTSNENIQHYYSQLAKEHHLKLHRIKNDTIDPALLVKAKCPTYLQLQAIPISETEKTITIATADPSDKNRKAIEAFWGKKSSKNLELVIASRQDISGALAHRFRTELTHDITYKRFDIDPVHSASYSFSLSEKIVLITILLILTGGFIWKFYITLLVISLFLSMGTVTIMAYKMGLTLRIFRWPQVTAIKIDTRDDQLPVYTVLIPLLREKEETLSVLLKSLQKLDYAQNKLDVKLLLEEDDDKTLETIAKFSLPWNYEVLLVPPGLPRSKPRACNYGAYLAFGEYLTIYDAEDQPDADQLKQALKCFAENDKETVCVQAALNFYNHKRNLLTRLFTIEYTHWFDSFVPALVYLKAPVPLGGTSNHFKVKTLLKIGCWDPYIGTEDADIGIRIYRLGYKTNCITSTTYEEANTDVFNWFKQRARWNKGYMQTYLVNMRDPLKMIKQVGFIKFVNFQLFVGGNVFIQLANLPLWFFLLASYITYMNAGLPPYPKIAFFVTWYNFLIGNLILLGSEAYAVYRRGLYRLLPFVPLKIFYWLQMSFAGYYAIIELLVRPGYWYKTEHGFGE